MESTPSNSADLKNSGELNASEYAREEMLAEFEKPEIARVLKRISIFGSFQAPSNDIKDELHELGEVLGQHGVSIVIGGKYGYLSEVADGVIESEGRVIVVNAEEHKATKGISTQNIPGVLREVAVTGGYIGKKRILFHEGVGAYLILPRSAAPSANFGTENEVSDALGQRISFDVQEKKHPRPIIFLGESWRRTFEESFGSKLKDSTRTPHPLEHIYFVESAEEIIELLTRYSASQENGN